MTIKQAIEDYLQDIIPTEQLYNGQRKAKSEPIHEIIKIQVTLEDGAEIDLYDPEQYVYSDYPECFHSEWNQDTKEYLLAYTLPYAEQYMPMEDSEVKKIQIEDIRVISKKDATIDDIERRYDQWIFAANVFKDTEAFQIKYGLMTAEDVDTKRPQFLEDDNMRMKIGHLEEELNEIKKSYADRDLAECADGLMDLIYVAAGLANLMHLPCYYLWCDVQNSNMAFKKRVERLEEATKRGSTFDVRKTDRWIAPRGKELIVNQAKKQDEYLEAMARYNEKQEQIKV